VGLEFVEIEANDRALLQKRLAGETPANDISTKLVVTGLFLLVGAAIIAAMVLMIS
jgi:hypothetical protein